MLAASPPTTLRMVLIEDNLHTCLLLNRFFSLEEDIEIVGTAHSGYDGLRMVEALAPNVVLTDFNLPDIDGQQITWEVRQRNPAVSVVVMSAEIPTGLADQMRRAGASDFILKDGNPEQIILAVRRIMRPM